MSIRTVISELEYAVSEQHQHIVLHHHEAQTILDVFAATEDLIVACKEQNDALVAIDANCGEPTDAAQRAAVTELKRVIALGRQAIAKRRGGP